MTDLPPELFTERPVSSDFSSRGPSYAMRRLLTLAFAVLMIGGGIYWWVGDTPSGNPQDIPIVKADGNYKQRPEQPGGIDIPHQDVQVYQELDANNNDKAQVEHLLPPPETPQIQANQNPTASIQSAPSHIESLIEDKPLSGTISTAPVVPTTVSAPVANVPSVAQVPTAVVDTTPARLSEDVQKNIILTAPSPVTEQHTQVQPVAISKTAQTVTKSPLPAVAVSPKSDSLTIEQIIKNVSQNKPSIKVGPIISGKGRIIQLASLPDQAAAQKDMHQLQNKYATVLGATTLHIVRADLAKGTYYRIQSQTISEQQAQNICASLKKLNAGCILVTTR